jgi:membrane fusion protein (multidrug efflux system)
VFVLTKGKDGKTTRAQLRLVSTGPVLGDEIVILDGVAEGERVAASGSFKLRDGALVVVADTASAPAKSAAAK